MVGPSTADVSLKSTLKFLCSYGGKIVPRHPDGKLRYLGGQTRVLAVHHSTPFSELLLKMMDLYGSAVSVRCQLPTEDLDALVSITCDEDLANLIEEYERFASPLKIRAFLFPPKPLRKQIPTITSTTSSPTLHHLSLSSSKSSSSSSSSNAASCGSGCSPRYSVQERALRHKMLPPLRAPVSLEKSKGKSVIPRPVLHPQYCYHGHQHYGNPVHYYPVHNGKHNH